MTHEERISQLEIMVSEVLRRLDQLTAELHATNETLRLFGQQQQVILDVLVRQTDTNTALLQRLTNHEDRLHKLENPGPANAA